MKRSYNCGQGDGEGSGCGHGINVEYYDLKYKNNTYKAAGRYAVKSHYNGYIERVVSVTAYYIGGISKSSFSHVPISYDSYYKTGNIKPFEATVEDIHE